MELQIPFVLNVKALISICFNTDSLTIPSVWSSTTASGSKIAAKDFGISSGTSSLPRSTPIVNKAVDQINKRIYFYSHHFYPFLHLSDSKTMKMDLVFCTFYVCKVSIVPNKSESLWVEKHPRLSYFKQKTQATFTN